MTNGHRKHTKRLGEHTDVYLYEEQSKNHHSRLDLMTKQSVLDLRLKGFVAESRVMGGLTRVGARAVKTGARAEVGASEEAV